MVAAIAMAGCGSVHNGGPAASSAVQVLAAETILGDIAQNVAGKRIAVGTLLPPIVDPHEFQPTPGDAVKIAQSQVLIVNGLGYEAWLTKSLQDSGGPRRIVVASDGLPSNGDPHLWMVPRNVIHYAQNIRAGLSAADPAGGPVYGANTEAYAAQLTDLDHWIQSEVARIAPEKRLLVTNHDALGVFAHAYGFRVVGTVIPSVTNEASPSARQLADLIREIQSSGAPAIFLDVSENQDLARQIALESGAMVVTDLYVETLSPPGGPASTYLDMMKHDVSVIVDALK
jgi:zinc/manganese transport system substrate-binding protein